MVSKKGVGYACGLMNFLFYRMMKVKLFKILVCPLALLALLLVGCGDLTAGDPAANGYQFNKSFYYYYSETCRYDAIGAYDCGRLESISPSFKVRLRIDSDDFATLNLDGTYYYYMPSEYGRGYDDDFGGYYSFYEDEDRLDVYKSGELMAYWGDDGYVTFYYYDLPY